MLILKTHMTVLPCGCGPVIKGCFSIETDVFSFEADVHVSQFATFCADASVVNAGQSDVAFGIYRIIEMIDLDLDIASVGFR